MRKFICMGLMLIFCAGMLSGCSDKLDVDTSTVFVEKKGNITSVDVEAMDKDYYDESELEEYITEHVTEYTAENGDTVKKNSFQVEDGIAKLEMQYDSCEDYSKFNGIEFYSGTVVTAQAEGYDFEADFSSVSDGEVQGSAAKADILANDDSKVVIIRANVAVQVSGNIQFVSSRDTSVTGKNTVLITGDGANEEAALTYIIYK